MNRTVDAINSLSIFGPRQAGAYREHARLAVAVLGPGVETRIRKFATEWAQSGEPGVLLLTGNAGTGKTALTEAWCEAAGGELPADDGLAEVGPERWAVKDLSGALEPDRVEILSLVRQVGLEERNGQLFVCANEGMLRASLTESDFRLQNMLEEALRRGATRTEDGRLTIVNMNRQRWTEPRLWATLVDYLAGEEKWTACDRCTHVSSCPIRSNAAALARNAPREALRQLVQLASGSSVATLRELLSLLAQTITGGLSCDDVIHSPTPFDASFGYFTLALGDRLPADQVERSTLLQGIQESRLGEIADLQVDSWLRDSGDAPPKVQELSEPHSPDHQSVVATRLGTMTFGRFGETLTVSDDADAVRYCLEDFVSGKSFLRAWRRRIFFESQEAVGGERGAFHRLTDFSFYGDLASLARALRDGREPAQERTRLMTGLNYLAAGFHAYSGMLVVPAPASMVARNPGSFRPPAPSIVHSEIPVSELTLSLEDGEELREMLDTDDVRVIISVVLAGGGSADLLLTPRLYQAIRESSDFRAPVGTDIPEMTELIAFYAELAEAGPQTGLRVVDPARGTIADVAMPELA